MPHIDIVLQLDRATCLAYYAGRFDNVRARSVEGRWVHFPATALRHIVGPDGINGVFRLCFSEAGKFQSITRLPR